MDATTVYWAASGTDANGQTDGSIAGTVARCDFDGSNPRIIATGLVSPNGLAEDATSLYFLTNAGSSGQLVKLAK